MLRRRRACGFRTSARSREVAPVRSLSRCRTPSAQAGLRSRCALAPAPLRRVPPSAAASPPGEPGTAAAGGTEGVEPRGVSALVAGTGARG